ncbi:MAG: winged helix DNA-binding domain-containing protein [Thermoleophilaceae bacterium]|nr:winged helix DNA-binding domain-containing protein [Thermoleophilaceae bacterium]
MSAIMDPLAIVRRRLHAQRLAAARFTEPAAAIGWLGAMQAQEFAEAKWSIGERVERCTDARVEEAFSRGEILRTHVLRPTWHFVAAADIRWMLRLTAPRVHAANRSMYRKLELDAGTFRRSHDVLARTLEVGAPLTRPELARALREAGIVAEGLRLGYVLMHAELEQLICSGPRRGKQQTYALLDHRAGEGAQLTRDEALGELALRYFRSRGPATVADLSTWSGLTVRDARTGLALVGRQLEAAEDGAGTIWIAAPAPKEAQPARGAFLIPMYDETVMGYKELKVVLAQAPPRPGLLRRPIVIDGRTVGSWKRTVTRRAVAIEASLFTPLDGSEAQALEAAVERFGCFMELPATLLAQDVTA